jgi:hypothetical protein
VWKKLKQARPDLLPRNDIGVVLLMPGDAVIKLGLRFRQSNSTASAAEVPHPEQIPRSVIANLSQRWKRCATQKHFLAECSSDFGSSCISMLQWRI